jgi:dTMP kinase
LSERPVCGIIGGVTGGTLIALEGIDGSGTTSQAKGLADRMVAAGYSVHLTAEPSTGPVGRLIRDALASREPISDRVLTLLFAGDRLDHLEREVDPHLQAGEVVLSDRYLLSSLAYQSVTNTLDWVMTLNGRAPKPHLSILLRVSPEIAATRRAARGGPPELFDAAERQRAVAEAYDRVFARDDVGPTVVLDANRGFDTVAAELWQTAKNLFSSVGAPA